MSGDSRNRVAQYCACRQSESINNGSLGFQFPSFISVTSRGSTPYRRTIEAVSRNCARKYVEQRLHNAEDVVVVIPHAERWLNAAEVRGRVKPVSNSSSICTQWFSPVLAQLRHSRLSKTIQFDWIDDRHANPPALGTAKACDQISRTSWWTRNEPTSWASAKSRATFTFSRGILLNPHGHQISGHVGCQINHQTPKLSSDATATPVAFVKQSKV